MIIEIVQMSEMSLSSCSAWSNGFESICVPAENGSVSRSAWANVMYGMIAIVSKMRMIFGSFKLFCAWVDEFNSLWD